MRTNPVKAALKAGKTVIGSEISGLRSPEVARIYAAAGFDFAFIDLEHSTFGIETVADTVRCARQAGIVPVVRVPQGEYAWVARMLDIGAQGIIVPRVNTPQEVKNIVSWTRYPPLGIRGFASTTAQTEGESVEPEDFMAHAHEHTLLVIQFERRQAIDNLEAMLSIPGVDVACLGYMDLSVDLGIPGQMKHPDMIKAVTRLVEVSRKHGVASGIITPDFEAVAHWAKAGMRFVSFGTDAMLLEQAAKAVLTQLRNSV